MGNAVSAALMVKKGVDSSPGQQHIHDRVRFARFAGGHLDSGENRIHQRQREHRNRQQPGLSIIVIHVADRVLVTPARLSSPAVSGKKGLQEAMFAAVRVKTSFRR